jgi:polyhydroxyalkanoate synthesis regulator phasin
MNEERSSGIGEGIRTGVGILAAIKEAIEETIEEAIERGDLSPDRAKVAVREAAERVQTSLGDARERFDLVTRKEFDALRLETEALRRRIDLLERRQDPTRIDAPGGSEGPGTSIPVD